MCVCSYEDDFAQATKRFYQNDNSDNPTRNKTACQQETRGAPKALDFKQLQRKAIRLGVSRRDINMALDGNELTQLIEALPLERAPLSSRHRNTVDARVVAHKGVRKAVAKKWQTTAEQE